MPIELNKHSINSSPFTSLSNASILIVGGEILNNGCNTFVNKSVTKSCTKPNNIFKNLAISQEASLIRMSIALT